MNVEEPDSLDVPAEHSADNFVKLARRRGVKGRIARLLEPEALALFPDEPSLVLTDRLAFEQAASRAIIGDAGNLELSYRRVDALASALERLGLARAGDVPDPFRRVWIENLAGERKMGVVLRRLDAEIAIFCPPGEQAFWDAGAVMTVSYRSFGSSAEYELKLADAVRLPDALVLHLTRPEAVGSIGRDDRRLPVQLEGSLRSEATSEHPEWGHWSPCELHDVSFGGCRASGSVRYERGCMVDLDLLLNDGLEGSILVTAEVRWVSDDRRGGSMHGLLIHAFPEGQVERYRNYVIEVTLATGDDVDTEPLERPFAALPVPEAQAARPGVPEPTPDWMEPGPEAAEFEAPAEVDVESGQAFAGFEPQELEPIEPSPTLEPLEPLESLDEDWVDSELEPAGLPPAPTRSVPFELELGAERSIDPPMEDPPAAAETQHEFVSEDRDELAAELETAAVESDEWEVEKAWERPSAAEPEIDWEPEGELESWEPDPSLEPPLREFDAPESEEPIMMNNEELEQPREAAEPLDLAELMGGAGPPATSGEADAFELPELVERPGPAGWRELDDGSESMDLDSAPAPVPVQDAVPAQGFAPSEEADRQRAAALQGLEQVSSELERTNRELGDVLEASSRERERASAERAELQRAAQASVARAEEFEQAAQSAEGQVEELSEQLAELDARLGYEERRFEERCALSESRLQGLEENHTAELAELRAEQDQRVERLEERLRVQLGLRRKLLKGFALAREEAAAIAEELTGIQTKGLREAAARERLERAAADGAAQIEALRAELAQASARADVDAQEQARLRGQIEELKLEVLHHSRWKRKWSGIVQRFTDPGA